MNMHEKNYVVISAHQHDNNPVANAILQSKLICDILALIEFDTSVVSCTGRYNGKEEESFGIIMPDDLITFDRIQDGLIDLGNKYGQECILLVFGGTDPAFAILYPLDKGIAKGRTEYIYHPWIEIDKEDCENIPASIGLTRVAGKCFIIDEDSDVTPIEIRRLDEIVEYFGANTRLLMNSIDPDAMSKHWPETEEEEDSLWPEDK